MKRLLALALLALIGYQFTHAMAPQEDYYQLLGVSKTASTDEIKKAFRRKALEYHPDKNPGDKNAEEMFKKILNAYEVLADEKTRKQYDLGKPITPDRPKQEGDKPFSRNNSFVPKFYPTDAPGIKKLYNELLGEGNKIYVTSKFKWGYIEDFCNNDKLADLKQDPEIKQMCEMLPIITKINQLEKLSAPEKKKIDQDAKVKKYYIDMQTAHVDSVNQQLKEEDIVEVHIENPRYEYLIKKLVPFTPATSAKILNVYSDVIEIYTKKKDFANAQKVADIANDKKAGLKYEIISAGQELPPKFQQALPTLDQAIANIETSKQRVAQEEAERQAKEAAEKEKAKQKEKLDDLNKRLDEMKANLVKPDNSGVTWAMVQADYLVSEHAVQDAQSYAIAKEAVKLLTDWAERNKDSNDSMTQILVSRINKKHRDLGWELSMKEELRKKGIYVN